MIIYRDVKHEIIVLCISIHTLELFHILKRYKLELKQT